MLQVHVYFKPLQGFLVNYYEIFVIVILKERKGGYYLYYNICMGCLPWK